jgi:hypothetical protein
LSEEPLREASDRHNGAAIGIRKSGGSVIILVNFADSGELLTKILILSHSETDTMSHMPSGLKRSENLVLKLLGRHAFLRGTE